MINWSHVEQILSALTSIDDKNNAKHLTLRKTSIKLSQNIVDTTAFSGRFSDIDKILLDKTSTILPASKMNTAARISHHHRLTWHIKRLGMSLYFCRQRMKLDLDDLALCSSK